MALIGTRAYLIDFDDGLFSLRDIVETLNAGELCVRLRTTIKQLSDHCTSQVCWCDSQSPPLCVSSLPDAIFMYLLFERTQQCESCRARAFVCELCKSSAAIFPFQVRQVATCPSCQVRLLLRYCFLVSCRL